MSDAVVSLVREALGPTGPAGFEGMLGELLGSLTGKRFRVARGGSQAGRDLTTDTLEATVIAVECKRYGETRELDEAELLGKLSQAVMDLPELDLWILATSRSVPSQLEQLLVKAGRRDGKEVRFIEAGDGPPSSLVLLLAHAPDVVLKYLEGKVSSQQRSSIQSGLEALATSSDFPKLLGRLRASFSDPSLGYDHWRVSQNQALIGIFSAGRASRAHLGQVIRVSTGDPSVIGRSACLAAFDAWYSAWPRTQRPVAVLGEEGDGKTWAIADWVARRQVSASFPAVVLLNSKDVTSTRPLDLLAESTSLQLGGSTDAWARRLRRWFRPEDNTTPLVVLVLDGVDERHTVDWRALFEGFAAEPWRKCIALAFTCRTSFWQRKFEPLRYLEATKLVVEPFSDNELETALDRRGVRSNDLPADLLPLLRKPRYLDLVLKMRERLAESGDISRQRLFYEDWKDRYSRKAGALDDYSFQRVLMDLAARAREGETRHSANNITSAVPPGAQREAAFVELSTGGILVEAHGRFVVQEDRLVLGMGLLLAEEVRDVVANGGMALDRIDQWLEPEPGMDLKGRVLEAASIHALSTDAFPLEGVVCLLWAWAGAQNAPEREDSLPGYMPLRPDAFFELAERAWADDDFHPVLHTLLRSAFIRYRDSAVVRPEMVTCFSRWLGFVHPAGYTALFGVDEAEADKQKAKITARVGQTISRGPLEIAGHRLTVIDRPGLLRLGRLALGVISCGERGPFIRAITAGVVADTVMGFPEKGESTAWVLRSSPDPVEDRVLLEGEALRAAGGGIPESAAHHLLEYVGTATAYDLRDRLPRAQPAAPDPCRSHLPWLPEYCLWCLEKAGFNTGQAARALSRGALDPGLSLPASFREDLAQITPTLLKDTLWSSNSVTAEDHAIESMESTLCAFAPEALADLFRQAASWFATREGRALVALTWGVRNHLLVFREREWRIVEAAWEKLLSHESVGEVGDAEEALFALLLNWLTPVDQLRYLVRRPFSAPNYLSYETLFAGSPDWSDVRRLLATQQPETILRVLWFVGPVAKLIPEDILDTIATIQTHADSVLRGAALRVLHRSSSSRHISGFLETGWRPVADQQRVERHWGSWLWIDHARDRPFEALFDRVAEDLWGFAVEARGFQPEDVEAYARNLQSFAWLSAPPVALPSFAIQREAGADPKELRPVDIRIGSDPLTLIPRGHSWGDSPPSDAEALSRALDLEGRLAADREVGRSVVAADAEQRQGGNPWLLAGPPASALEAVIGIRPELSLGWAEGVLGGPDADVRLSQHAGFFQDLCVALLRTLPAEGVRLHERLLDARGLGLTYYADIDVLMIDDALWTAPPVPAIEKARWQSIRRAKSDVELAHVALAAEYRSQGPWLLDELRRVRDSDSPLDRARVATLLGFMCDSKADEILDSWSGEKRADWVDEAIDLAVKRRKSIRLSQHWFEVFVGAPDDVRAWAAFRLFLHCVDRRFWVWSTNSLAEASPDTYTPHRRRFLGSAKAEINARIEGNEKAWKGVFLGTRIIDGEVAPWLAGD